MQEYEVRHIAFITLIDKLRLDFILQEVFHILAWISIAIPHDPLSGEVFNYIR